MNNNYMLKYSLNMAANDTAEIMVYGEICPEKWEDEVVTAKEFDALIKGAKQQGAKALNLRINSPGGAVFQAIAMRQMLINCGLQIKVAIEGLCASAATLLCCVPGAGVTISKGSMFMIHNPYTIALGTAAQLRKEADRLEKTEADVRNMYAMRCGKPDEEIKQLLDAETWFSAEEAVANGFCDSVTGVEQQAAYINKADYAQMRAMYANTPDLADKVIETVSTADKADSAGTATEIIEEVSEMEIKDITMEQLMAENSALYNAVLNAGAAAERDRMQEIDALTPAGYEEMAQAAKADGTSPVDFCKMIVKAQKQKGAEFLTSRAQETAPAMTVRGEAAETDEPDELKAFAREAKELAAQHKNSMSGMY